MCRNRLRKLYPKHFYQLQILRRRNSASDNPHTIAFPKIRVYLQPSFQSLPCGPAKILSSVKPFTAVVRNFSPGDFSKLAEHAGLEPVSPSKSYFAKATYRQMRQ